MTTDTITVEAAERFQSFTKESLIAYAFEAGIISKQELRDYILRQEAPKAKTESASYARPEAPRSKPETSYAPRPRSSEGSYSRSDSPRPRSSEGSYSRSDSPRPKTGGFSKTFGARSKFPTSKAPGRK